MASIFETEVAIRFFGDDLDPEDVGKRLGRDASSCGRKGETLRSESGRERVLKTGRWILSAQRREPGDVEAQVRELFGALTPDLAVWRDLAQKYHPDLFVGLFMKETNEGLEISAGCLEMVAARGVTLSLDVYGPFDPNEEPPAA